MVLKALKKELNLLAFELGASLVYRGAKLMAKNSNYKTGNWIWFCEAIWERAGGKP